MYNTALDIKGNFLTITIDLTKEYGRSSGTGKNIMVASSQGNTGITGHEDLGIRMNLNVWKYPMMGDLSDVLKSKKEKGERKKKVKKKKLKKTS